MSSIPTGKSSHSKSKSHVFGIWKIFCFLLLLHFSKNTHVSSSIIFFNILLYYTLIFACILILIAFLYLFSNLHNPISITPSLFPVFPLHFVTYLLHESVYHCYITLRKYHDNGNYYKRNHLIGAALSFHMFTK